MPLLVLRTDTLDTDVVRLLCTKYTVIIGQSENDITIELYPK